MHLAYASSDHVDPCERLDRPISLTRAVALLCTAVVLSSCSPSSDRSAARASQPPVPSFQKGIRHMNEFKIGDVVQITGTIMPGSVGTVVSFDDKRDKYLVRITEAVQNYYTADELELFER